MLLNSLQTHVDDQADECEDDGQSWSNVSDVA